MLFLNIKLQKSYSFGELSISSYETSNSSSTTVTLSA